MMNKKRWHKVPGTLAVEVGKSEGKWVNGWGKEIPACLSEVIERNFSGYNFDEELFEVVVGFESTGYYEPAQTLGPPDCWSPAEGTEERTMTYVRVNPPQLGTLGYNAAAGVIMTDQVAEAVFEAWYEDIQDVDLSSEND